METSEDEPATTGFSMPQWQQYSVAKQLFNLDKDKFVHTYSRTGTKGGRGKNVYRAVFFVGRVMGITINDDRDIEITLEHWAKATDNEGIIESTYTPGGPEDWWTETWCIDEAATVSLMEILREPTTDKQTGDEYVQLDLDKATAAINADFEEEMQDCTDTEAHGAVAEGRVSNKRHANEDLDELVAKEKQRRAALGINSDDDDY